MPKKGFARNVAYFLRSIDAASPAEFLQHFCLPSIFQHLQFLLNWIVIWSPAWNVCIVNFRISLQWRHTCVEDVPHHLHRLRLCQKTPRLAGGPAEGVEVAAGSAVRSQWALAVSRAISLPGHNAVAPRPELHGSGELLAWSPIPSFPTLLLSLQLYPWWPSQVYYFVQPRPCWPGPDSPRAVKGSLPAPAALSFYSHFKQFQGRRCGKIRGAVATRVALLGLTFSLQDTGKFWGLILE